MAAEFEHEIAALRWVLENGDDGTGVLPLQSSEPSGQVPALTKVQLDKTLSRLKEANLIVGERIETLEIEWRGLRPTANGLRLLGEWPPSDDVAWNELIAAFLFALAERLEGEDATTADRGAGSIAREGGKAVGDAVKGEIRRLGGEAVT